MTTDKGKSVVDLKWTQKSGKPDSWGTKKGMGGGTQQKDYNDINKQLDPNSEENVTLDKNTCKCDENPPEQKQVYEYDPALDQLLFMPIIEGVPSFSPSTVKVKFHVRLIPVFP